MDGAALFTNITNTASGANSTIFDFQVGGSSILKQVIGNNNYILLSGSSSTAIGSNGSQVLMGSTASVLFAIGSSFIGLANAEQFGFSGAGASAYVDAGRYRDAAGIIAQRNGTSAQSSRVYNTYTNATNYERGVFDWQTAANVLTLGAQAAGTGVLRGVNIVGASLSINGTAGVTCSGTPTSSFAATNGVVTHC